MQVCMVCGAANPPTAPECESCGSDLPAGQSAPPPPAPVEAPDPADSKCPFCSLPTDPDAKECPHCRLSLDAKDPLNAPAPRGHADNMTGRYEDFQRKVEGLRMGSISPAEFIEWLANIRVTLAGKRASYINTVRDMGYQDANPEEVDIAVNGILDFEDAIEDMWEFTLGKTDISGLDTALAKMWQANEMINDAMRINRGFRAQLEDDWGYM